ncbi:MAG: hypothetical protein NUV51_05730, partial [Sulfuricaulis sp.]|nr:hypothetical protein [Sulfuricaulis sp.]
GRAAIAGTEKSWQSFKFGRQLLPVRVIRRNTHEHTLNARMRTQAFKSMQNDRTTEKREILLG